MSEVPFFAAASMGLLGSVHCAVMCGPLAVAGSCRGDRIVPTDALSYFAGRAAAYAFLGALFGALAHRMGALHHALAQSETFWVVAVGLVAVLHGLRLVLSAKRPGLVTLPARRGPRAWASLLSQLLPKRGLGLGIATGFLPCGLLMGGLMLAASSRAPLPGALTMVVFSVATLPGLLAPLAARRAMARGLAHLSPAWYGALWCALGLWIAARPLLHGSHGGH